MIINKCDRCGAIISDPEKNKNIFDTLTEAIQNALYQQITYGVSKYVDGEFSQRLDLCKDCQKSLNEWLNVPKEEKQTPCNNCINVECEEYGNVCPNWEKYNKGGNV